MDAGCHRISEFAALSRRGGALIKTLLSYEDTKQLRAAIRPPAEVGA